MSYKVAVVTGASAGLGRAIAMQFAKKKLSVGLISRNKERLESLKREIEELGVKAAIAICDVAYPDQVENASEIIEKELGAIDIWVNNAMASVFSPFKEITSEEFKRVTEVTYLGYVYGYRQPKLHGQQLRFAQYFERSSAFFDILKEM